jgi:alpha-L-fucosidase
MKNLTIPLLLIFILCGCHKNVLPPEPVGPLPTKAQLEWHRMEMNAFVHFSINTFTNKEWGYGDESPKLFNPDSLDTDQWLKIFKETGFKMVILTCKHHDGFCLWPSQHTQHSVASSPVKTDIVKAVTESAARYGLKFGVYLSPWDRNHPEYGREGYVNYYRMQLRELFAAYSEKQPVFEMWFDGANGGDGYYGGAREKRQIKGSTYYDWPTTLKLVQTMQPEIIFFSDAGPGVRWVGNERGEAGETNWNTITADTLFAGKGGIEKLLNTGSEAGTKWIPAETDVSIRPGWFYHPEEDSLVKSPERLFEIYLSSVGRGSTLLLNIPPNRHGKIHRNDIASLQGFKKILDQTFKNNLAPLSEMNTDQVRGDQDQYGVQNLLDSNPETYWATNDGVTSATLTMEWDAPQQIGYVELQEPIQLGQRIKSFVIEAKTSNGWEEIGKGTTIGYKRIIKTKEVSADAIRIKFLDSKKVVAITEVRVFPKRS